MNDETILGVWILLTIIFTICFAHLGGLVGLDEGENEYVDVGDGFYVEKAGGYNLVYIVSAVEPTHNDSGSPAIAIFQYGGDELPVSVEDNTTFSNRGADIHLTIVDNNTIEVVVYEEGEHLTKFGWFCAFFLALAVSFLLEVIIFKL